MQRTTDPLRAALVVLAVAACTSITPIPTSPATVLAPPVETASPIPSVARSEPPTSTPIEDVFADLHAGGTCSASQFKLGTSIWGPGYGSQQSIFVHQPMTNKGKPCVLALPDRIAVASSTGPFVIVPTLSGGRVTSWHLDGGDTAMVILGAWWPYAYLDAASPAIDDSSPCSDPIVNATRVGFPFRSGTLVIDLGAVWKTVCSLPASTSLTFETK
jgi:hypothetical protein